MGDQSKGNKLVPFNLKNVPPTVQVRGSWVIDLFVKPFFISTVVLTYSYTVLWLSLFIGLFSYQSTHSGLVLNFLGGFEGSADVLHLPNCGAGDGQDMEAAYPKKTKVLQC